LNVRVPFLLSRVVDALQAAEADKASQAAAAYVLGRVLTSACGELRSICFARVSFGSGRRFARSTFASLPVWKSTSVGCTRQFFTKSFLGDDVAALAPSSGEEPTSPRHRAGVASMAWRSTR
jgi:hypothetical protein